MGHDEIAEPTGTILKIAAASTSEGKGRLVQGYTEAKAFATECDRRCWRANMFDEFECAFIPSPGRPLRSNADGVWSSCKPQRLFRGRRATFTQAGPRMACRTRAILFRLHGPKRRMQRGPVFHRAPIAVQQKFGEFRTQYCEPTAG